MKKNVIIAALALLIAGSVNAATDAKDAKVDSVRIEKVEKAAASMNADAALRGALKLNPGLNGQQQTNLDALIKSNPEIAKQVARIVSDQELGGQSAEVTRLQRATIEGLSNLKGLDKTSKQGQVFEKLVTTIASKAQKEGWDAATVDNVSALIEGTNSYMRSSDVVTSVDNALKDLESSKKVKVNLDDVLNGKIC